MSVRMRFFIVPFLATVFLYVMGIALAIHRHPYEQGSFVSWARDLPKDATQLSSVCHFRDFCADFFNQMTYVVNRDPYFELTNGRGEHIYPPLAYLLVYPFASMFRELVPGGLYAYWADWRCMLAGCGFLGLCFSFLVWMLVSIGKGYGGWQPIATAALCALSGVSIYAMERGNLIVVAALGIAVFLRFHDLPGRKAAVLSVLGLSMAVALKIYPLLFAVIWLSGRRFGRFAGLCLCSVFLCVVPFFFFNHSVFENAVRLIGNLKVNAGWYFNACPPNLTLATYVLKHFTLTLASFVALAEKIMGLGCLALCFRVVENWKKWFLIASSLVFIAGTSMYYTAVYFLPAIVAYLGVSERIGVSDAVYMICFLLFLVPFQFGMTENMNSVNPIVATLAIHVVVFQICLESFRPSASANRSSNGIQAAKQNAI